MRDVFRKKLLQYVEEHMALKKGAKGQGTGGDPSFKEEFLKTFVEKEQKIKMDIDQERVKTKKLLNSNRALKEYANSLRNLAEDWAPIGQPLPNILLIPAPESLEDPAFQLTRDNESD